MQTRLFAPKFITISLILPGLFSVLFSGCGPQSSADASLTDADSMADQSVETQALAEGKNGEKSRGLEMANARIANFSFKDEFPLLYKLLQGDTQLLSTVESYAGQVITAKNIGSEEDILSLFQLRDEKIIPLMEPVFENMDPEALNRDWEGINGELSRLGMSMTSAEGMFTGLGKKSMLENAIEQLGSEALRYFVEFEAAYTESMNGEYPYLNMEPYSQMVILGEKINALAPNPYVTKIEGRFHAALMALTDIHLVSDPTARQDAQPFVGGANTEAYPFMSETETARNFANVANGSKYQKVMASILENTSEISNRPENIYVIVIEWAETQDMAKNRVFSHLSKGEDVPHYLKIRTGDGKDKYAISYRFYEDGDKAEEALEKAKNQFPNAQMIFCSVRGDQLYELGI